MNTSVNTSTATVIVDDGPPLLGDLTMEQEMLLITSSGATKPDPTWEQVDTAGHFHAYAADGDLPTLKHESVPMSCDGSCGGVCGGEGYHTDRWTCRICGEEIQPRRIPDYQARTTGIPTPGRKSAEVVVRSDRDHPRLERGADVTLRVSIGDEQLIGMGQVVSERMQAGVEGQWLETRIAAMSLEPRMGRTS